MKRSQEGMKKTGTIGKKLLKRKEIGEAWRKEMEQKV
jgi:hypothetical protein